MSIFDTKTLSEKLATKERETVVDNLLEPVFKQIKAAAEIGLTDITINFKPLWREVADDDLIRYMNYSPYYNDFIAKLYDEDFNVEKSDDLSDKIYVSWGSADNFGTKASEMWRLSKDDYSVENSNILYKIEREILRNIDINGKAEAIIPYSVFGYEGMPFTKGNDVKTKILNYHLNESQVKKHYVYKYIEEYERLFKISTTEDGVMIVYKR